MAQKIPVAAETLEPGDVFTMESTLLIDPPIIAANFCAPFHFHPNAFRLTWPSYPQQWLDAANAFDQEIADLAKSHGVK